MVRLSALVMCVLTVAVAPSESQFLQSFRSSFSVSSWSSSGDGHVIERSWSSSPLGGIVERSHEVTRALGGKVLQDVRSELVEDVSGTLSGTKDEVRCSGSHCEERLSVIDPSSVHGPAASAGSSVPHDRPLIASSWRVPVPSAAPPGAQGAPCHQGAPRVASNGGVTAMAAGDPQVVSDGGVPAMAPPGATLATEQKKVGRISPEEICGIAVGLALCGTALLAAAKLVCRGCRHKRLSVKAPEVRQSMLEESPTSIVSSESPSPTFSLPDLEDDPYSAYVLRVYAREANASERSAAELYMH